MARQLGPTPVLLAGASILLTFVQSSRLYVGRASRVRFYLQVILAAGSPITTVNVKLQQRYNDDSTQLPYTDLPSSLDDVQGAAQPKGPTFEITHTITGLVAPVAAPGAVLPFYLDRTDGLVDIVAAISANAQGIAGDLITLYPVLG